MSSNDHDDDTTPAGKQRPPSPEAIAIAGIAAALNHLAQECGPLASAWDGLAPDERRFVARAYARKYRELGDVAHDVARSLEEIANG